MFIAHAPAGFLVATTLLKHVKHLSASPCLVIGAGMLGALAPDFDIVWFYGVDHRQVNHHRYFTHWPVFWIGLLLAAALWRHWAPQKKAALLMLVFCLGGVLHMILDSLVGGIWWLAPVVDRSYALFEVPAVTKPWWLNFFIHWSFGVEILICAWAAVVYRRRSAQE